MRRSGTEHLKSLEKKDFSICDRIVKSNIRQFLEEMQKMQKVRITSASGVAQS